MPHATAVALLQDACRELRVTDPTQLSISLRQMALALTALPKMEGFIKEVCTTLTLTLTLTLALALTLTLTLPLTRECTRRAGWSRRR